MEMKTNLTEKGQRDYLLIQRALRDGDQKAYADLLHHYRDSLYFMMLKMTNNPYDADDLTIEAFGKAFKKLDQYTPDYAFSTWLFKIASNNCIDFLRRNRKNTLSMRSDYEGSAENDITNTIISQSPDPEENVINEQKIKLMREVVEKLKPHYRHLVELRYFDEYSYEEIAVELDLPLGTVKAQLFRAREFLFQILKNARERI
jgi:RNA polymerase sigma factor (sigma-70 family)